MVMCTCAVGGEAAHSLHPRSLFDVRYLCRHTTRDYAHTVRSLLPAATGTPFLNNLFVVLWAVIFEPTLRALLASEEMAQTKRRSR